MKFPRAYFITFSCYGARPHGDALGSIDRCHNRFGAPYLSANPARVRSNARRMEETPYEMDRHRRDLVLQTIQEICSYRGWILLAAHVRTNHVHVVVQAAAPPERVMNDFRVLASRKLNEKGLDRPQRKRWSRHGSTRYLWTSKHVEAAVQYVIYKQGSPMAVFMK